MIGTFCTNVSSKKQALLMLSLKISHGLDITKRVQKSDRLSGTVSCVSTLCLLDITTTRYISY